LHLSKPEVKAGPQFQSKQRAALCLADEFAARHPEYGNRSKILFTPCSTPKSRTSEAGGYRKCPTAECPSFDRRDFWPQPPKYGPIHRGRDQGGAYCKVSFAACSVLFMTPAMGSAIRPHRKSARRLGSPSSEIPSHAHFLWKPRSQKAGRLSSGCTAIWTRLWSGPTSSATACL
jgi:hypothetical protein